jgi:ATP-binding protein involved in chromosome partitioning
LERRSENLAEDLGVPFLGGIPIVQSIRRLEITVVLQHANSICSGEHFDEVTRNVVQETVNRMKIYLLQRPLRLLQWQAVQQLKKI